MIHEPIPVQLSDVYDLDFGRRTVDLPLWHELRASAPDGPSCEVGVGDGRVSAGLPGVRYGIDIDRAFVRWSRQKGIEAVLGDAAIPEAWATVPADCGFVFCAYSTLFLIPHSRQADVLRNMAAHVRPDGLLAVETFFPAYHGNGPGPTTDVPVGSPAGGDVPWIRRTTYDVEQGRGGLTGITRATRLYGPRVGDWRMELQETIFWRTMSGMLELFSEAGLRPMIRQRTGADVPDGSVLTTWTRP